MSKVIDFAPRASTASRLAVRRLRMRGRKLVDRPRLSDLATQLPLIVKVEAPAGYGKTSLLQQWDLRLKAENAATAWVTANGGPQDARAILLALSSLLPATARNDEVPVGAENDFCNVLRVLLPQFVGSPAPRTLFIDNFDAISLELTQQLLSEFVALPQIQVSLVMAMRRESNLALSKLRVSGDLLEIGCQHLRFSATETEEFLSLRGLPNAEQGVVRAGHLAGGWVAVLESMAIRYHGMTAAPIRFFEQLADSWIELDLYFEEEIMSKQTPMLRDFLIEVGPLNRFCRALVAATSPNLDADLLLDELKSAGLVEARDGQSQTWFQLHPLFTSFLERRCAQADARNFARIHNNAATWHREYGSLRDAVRHFYAAGDMSSVAEALLRASGERKRRGHYRNLTSWVARLPSAALDPYPALQLESACTYAALFEIEAAKIQVSSIRARFNDLDPKARDDLLAVDGLIAVYEDDPKVALEAGDRGLRECCFGDAYTLGSLRLVSAVGAIAHGLLDDARHHLVEARACHQKAASHFGIASALALQGLTHAIEGALVQSVAAWRMAEAEIYGLNDKETVEVIAIGYLPETLYEWNQIDEAEGYLSRCMANSMEVALPDMIVTLFITAARIAVARNQIEIAAQFLDDGEVIGLQRKWPRLVKAIRWERVRFALRAGRLSEAQRLRDRLELDGRFTEAPGILTHALETEGDLIGELRFDAYLKPGRPVLSRLRHEVAKALSQNRVWRAVRLLTIDAATREVLGERNAAMRSLRQALELASPGRMVRSFVDEGPQIVGLVAGILEHERQSPSAISTTLLESILTAGGEPVASPGAQNPLLEQLSRRELDLLRLLAVGHSNKELAARLFVSEHTIKWHLQHVFAKLGVKSRTRAVSVARAHSYIPQ